MKQTQARPRRRRRRGCLPVLLVLAALLVAGALLFVFGGRRLARFLYPQRYSQYVETYAQVYGVDPLLLYAFIRTESGFDPQARSSADARGLMQITEQTFDWIKGRIAPEEELTFDDLDDPETNIRFGAHFVSACLDRYAGDVATAAAAYHSGWGTVDGLLKEDRFSQNGVTLHTFPYVQMNLYVQKITAAYARYQQIYP